MTRKTAKEQAQLQSYEAMARDREARGLNIREYCREIGICPSTYYNRQTKAQTVAAAMMTQAEQVAAPETVAPGKGSLVPKGWAVPVVRQSGTIIGGEMEGTGIGGTLEIAIGEITLRVSAGTDLNLLANVCRVVKAL